MMSMGALVSAQNKTFKPFSYKDKGKMATVGRASAVAQIRSLPDLKGFAAWVIWVVLHVMSLLGNRNRFAAIDSQHFPSKRDAKKGSKQPTGNLREPRP